MDFACAFGINSRGSELMYKTVGGAAWRWQTCLMQQLSALNLQLEVDVRCSSCAACYADYVVRLHTPLAGACWHM
jgi:hypothetical protein